MFVCFGTGGVGKTTVSAGLGTALSRRGLRTLVVTCDPARRLATASGECPYVRSGLCNPAVSSTYEGIHEDYMCYDTKLTLRKCRDHDGGSRSWLYPITTFRDVVQQ